MKAFSILDILKDLETVTYSFNDNTNIKLNANDFINYCRWKCKNVPSFNDGSLSFLSDIDSFETLFNQYNIESADSMTRIKNALGLTYEVLDNYNGSIESTTTDTYANADTLTFNSRTDTRTLNYNDTLSFNERTDTRTFNNNDTLSFNNREDTHSYDSNNPITEVQTTSGTTRTNNIVYGFNDTQPNNESASEVIKGYNQDPERSTTVQSGSEKETKSGSEQTSHSGTIADGKTGSEQTSHSGTIADGKTGSEQTSHSGTVTHSYEEIKHGNLGVTTSQQMLTSEIELRLKYKLRPLIVQSFIEEYFYL